MDQSQSGIPCFHVLTNNEPKMRLVADMKGIYAACVCTTNAAYCVEDEEQDERTA